MIEIDCTKDAHNSSNLCACKGIRKCAICAPNQVLKEKRDEETLVFKSENNGKRLFIYCIKCEQSIPLDENIRKEIVNFINDTSNFNTFNCYCKQAPEHEILRVNGIFLINNFVSDYEESYLINEINKSPWVDSQSGRFKQDYGPQANFNKKKLKYNKFTGLPHYSKFIIERFSTLNSSIFENFNPVELCNLKYEPHRASCIDPHYDDFWLWGNRLVTLNLLSNTFLSLSPDPLKISNINNCEILIPLSRLSLNIISDDARYKWLHSIKKSHIKSTRVAITFRELSDEFKSNDEKGVLGKEIEKLAVCFTGVSTGLLEELLKENKILEKLNSNQNFEFNNNVMNLIKNQIDLDLYKIIKQGRNNMKILSNNRIIKFISLNEMCSKKLLEIQNKISNELNNKNFKYFNIKIDSNQSLNVCIQNCIDTKNEFLEDLDVIFNIGIKIAEWRDLSSKLFDKEIDLIQLIDQKDSIYNFFLINQDFNAYKKLYIEKLNDSNLDIGFKSKSIAILINTHFLIKLIEKNDSILAKGLVLNDFKPEEFCILNKDNILCLTSFQNINYSYYLNDLALSIAHIVSWLVINRKGTENVSTALLNGYQTRFELNDLELKLLNRLIILNLILIITELDKFYLDKLLEIFDNFYKNSNYIFN